MRVARIWHSKDGYKLVVESVPDWAIVLARVSDKLCALTRHVACTPREWMFRVGWDRDEDGHCRHSLGGGLWDLSNVVLMAEHQRSKTEFEMPLTDEQVAKHFPDARMEFLEGDREDSAGG